MHFATLLVALPLALAAPIITPREGQVIPGKYIIKMKDNATTDAVESAIGKCRKNPSHRYGFGDFKGFSAEIDQDAVNAIADMEDVEYIEEDAEMSTMAYVTQTNAPWGLGRISSRTPGSRTYRYDDSAGAGTCAYVLDTGIETSHPDFQGRASTLANFSPSGNADRQGHGTHVAGTIGGATYGVAKRTNLYAVKVLGDDGRGSNSMIIAGIDFAARDRTSRSGCARGSVANLSLGGPRSSAVNSAVRSATNSGLLMVVAAGNEAQDAGNVSPASEPSACTVGSTTINDQMSSFSNFGTSVDIFAPGTDITSAWIGGAIRTISGTSMASPHVAGLAVYLSAFEGTRSPAAMCSRIQSLATTGRISGLRTGSPNRLAFNGNPSG